MQKLSNNGAARLAAATILGVIPGLSFANLQVYASPTGSDAFNGLSASTPVKSISTAVQIVRNQRGNNPSTPATINLAAGRYQLS